MIHTVRVNKVERTHILAEFRWFRETDSSLISRKIYVIFLLIYKHGKIIKHI